MTDLPATDPPTLAQLFAEAREHAREREVDAVEALLANARATIDEEVPPGPRRERLLFGCDRVENLVADEPLVAAEYLQALHDRTADDG